MVFSFCVGCCSQFNYIQHLLLTSPFSNSLKYTALWIVFVCGLLPVFIFDAIDLVSMLSSISHIRSLFVFVRCFCGTQAVFFKNQILVYIDHKHSSSSTSCSIWLKCFFFLLLVSIELVYTTPFLFALLTTSDREFSGVVRLGIIVSFFSPHLSCCCSLFSRSTVEMARTANNKNNVKIISFPLHTTNQRTTTKNGRIHWRCIHAHRLLNTYYNSRFYAHTQHRL